MEAGNLPASVQTSCFDPGDSFLLFLFFEMVTSRVLPITHVSARLGFQKPSRYQPACTLAIGDSHCSAHVLGSCQRRPVPVAWLQWWRPPDLGRPASWLGLLFDSCCRVEKLEDARMPKGMRKCINEGETCLLETCTFWDSAQLLGPKWSRCHLVLTMMKKGLAGSMG